MTVMLGLKMGVLLSVLMMFHHRVSGRIRACIRMKDIGNVCVLCFYYFLTSLIFLVGY